MAQIREIKSRMKAVGNIERITRTMQLIATARFQKMQSRATSAQAYTLKIREVVGELTRSVLAGGEVSHPLLSGPDPAVGRRCVLVITSNRGLCGGYNASILRTAAKLIAQHSDSKLDLEVVGKKGAGYFKFTGREMSNFHSHIGDSPSYEEIERLAQAYMDGFTAGKYDAVDVIYTAFVSMSRQEARVTQLLPMEPPTGDNLPGTRRFTSAAIPPGTPGKEAANTEYEFTPDAEELLADLLPVTVKTQLFQCFNESLVSEQLARMVAMKAATDAAGKMKKFLHRKFNRARQTAITTELSEIISGSAALE